MVRTFLPDTDQGRTNKTNTKDQQCKQKQAFWTKLMVKDVTDSTIQPKYCHFLARASCCKTLISAAKLHKVAYNPRVKPNH